jgi:hypothetical protein
MVVLTVLLVWITLAVVAAPVIGRLLAGCGAATERPRAVVTPRTARTTRTPARAARRPVPTAAI